LCLSLPVSVARRDLHSFPTRRSSDLRTGGHRQFWPPVSDGAPPVRSGGALRSGHLRRQYGERGLGSALESAQARDPRARGGPAEDRKSTRLNSSHVSISYAVFCLKKK